MFKILFFLCNAETNKACNFLVLKGAILPTLSLFFPPVDKIQAHLTKENTQYQLSFYELQSTLNYQPKLLKDNARSAIYINEYEKELN